MATPQQSGRMSVQVVMIASNIKFLKTMLVPRGQTVGWCANASGIYSLHPHLHQAKIGVWGKLVNPESLAIEGDRIELYQPSRSTKKPSKKR